MALIIIWILIKLIRHFRPDTICRLHRKCFGKYWSRVSKNGKGRPSVTAEIRERIRRLITENPGWGAPRIHGELLKLKIKVSLRTVSRILRAFRPNGGKGNKWNTFARNQSRAFAAMDFFVVPTLTFRQLYGFFIIGHGRRRILYFAVTYRPTQQWVAEQLRMAAEKLAGIKYIIHDNDPVFSAMVKRTMRSLGITSKPITPYSPWENGIAERWVGSVRRELLDHVIIINQRHLYKLLEEYVEYYNDDRTHLSLGKDSPAGRPVQKKQSEDDKLIALPRCGGLHHKYEWRQAA